MAQSFRQTDSGIKWYVLNMLVVVIGKSIKKPCCNLVRNQNKNILHGNTGCLVNVCFK